MAMRFDHFIAACVLKVAKRYRGNAAVRVFDEQERQPIEVEPRVSIDQKEALVESILSAPKSTPATGRTIFDPDVDGDIQRAVNAAFRYVTGDALGVKACKEENLTESETRRFNEKIFKEWPPSDVKHCFGCVWRQRAKPVTQPTDKDDTLLRGSHIRHFGNSADSTRPQIICATVMYSC